MVVFFLILIHFPVSLVEGGVEMDAAFGPMGAEGDGHIIFGLHGVIKFFKFPVKGTFRNIRQK